MKILDKLKNALFEEEYIEVEEKPKKVKEKPIKKKKEKTEEFNHNDMFEVEKPIAKRIVPQEKKVSAETSEAKEQEPLRESEYLTSDPKITIVTDEDLKVENDYKIPDTTEVKKRRVDNTVNLNQNEEKYQEPVDEIPKITEPKLYKASIKESYLENYTPHEYGNYEKQKQKEGFKPSPIISPIYGIVEDTRFMDKPKKREVRITTSYSHDKMDIDEIRRKAFGNLSDDISDNIGFNHHIEENENSDDDNILLDLTDKEPPKVNNITMGDAVEYFEDLGLEYNEDYVDSSKITRTEKNASLDKEKVNKIDDEIDSLDENITEIKIEEELEPIKKDTIVREKNKDTTNETDSDNLFDLIDSMYDE